MCFRERSVDEQQLVFLVVVLSVALHVLQRLVFQLVDLDPLKERLTLVKVHLNYEKTDPGQFITSYAIEFNSCVNI